MNRLRLLLLSTFALALSLALTVVVIARYVLAPAPGEWAMPLRLGPVPLQVGVPSVLRLVTAPWFAAYLDGRRFDTANGALQFHWDNATRTLAVRCAPCTLHVAALGAQPLRLAQAQLRIQRDFDTLTGTLEATDARTQARLQGQWRGELSQQNLRVDITFDEAPIAHWYAIAAPSLPELAHARIDGTLALRTQIELPAGHVALQPRIAQFGVAGLGTDALLGARSSCGAPSRLNASSWLARAVIAAEDQRFFEHPGYDLTELLTAFADNQMPGKLERGASTLSQQLAKLLVTGSERTLQRKLRELLYAVEMEQTLGKARILTLYLDNAPWGEAGLCGAQAAARYYFQRDARQLSPAQAATLAAMLNAPVRAAQRWEREGTPDAARTRWVAEGIRGIGMRQRSALLKEVAQATVLQNP